MNTSKITELTEKEPTLEELQEIVGGYIQIVTSKDGTADIIMDEEGKLKNKNINVYATQLWQGDGKTLFMETSPSVGRKRALHNI